MGGQGSGSGMRWNTTRSKDFIEQYKCIDTRSFPYRYMKDIPEVGIQTSAHGVELRVFKNKLEVHHRHDTSRAHFSIPFSLSQGYYGNKRYWFVCPTPTCTKRIGRVPPYLGLNTLSQESYLPFALLKCFIQEARVAFGIPKSKANLLRLFPLSWYSFTVFHLNSRSYFL